MLAIFDRLSLFDDRYKRNTSGIKWNKRYVSFAFYYIQMVGFYFIFISHSQINNKLYLATRGNNSFADEHLLRVE